jgi:DNA-binding NarL/FixJ family response regulator
MISATIVIADDFPVVRTGLKSCVEEAEGFSVIGEAGDGERALELIKDLRPDLAIVDVDMPKMGGLDVLKAMKRLTLDTKVIFLSFHKDEDIFRACLELGGKGYLIKDSAMQEIVTAIEAVMSGKVYVSSEIAVQLLQGNQATNAVDPLLRDLTPSELRILRLIGEGLSSKEIGSELSIHYRTVENHRTNICRKLKIEGANALLRFAVQHKARI